MIEQIFFPGSILNGELQRDLALFSPQVSPLPHRLLTPPSPHPSLPYCCDLCTMRFHSISALQKHALTVHGFRAKEAGSLFCVQCNLQFPTPALFAEHYVLFHGSAMGLFAQPPVEQIKPTDLSLTKKSSPRRLEGGERLPSKRPRHAENGISSTSNGLESSRRTPTVNLYLYASPVIYILHISSRKVCNIVMVSLWHLSSCNLNCSCFMFLLAMVQNDEKKVYIKFFKLSGGL